jgi:ABC-2 type transport system permease protein
MVLARALLNVPDWVVSLSIFHRYGSPITDGLNWGAFFARLGIALVVLAVVQFNWNDVERAE